MGISNLVDFAIRNFSRLQPADYVLIVVIAFLLSGGVFLVFRWLYGALIAAQEQLIKTKDSTIAEYERSLSVTTRARDSIGEDFVLLRDRFDSLVSVYHQVEQDKTVLERGVRQARRNSLVLLVLYATSEMLHTQYRLLYNAQQMLITYLGMEVEKLVSGAPDSVSFVQALDAIEEGLEESERTIDAFATSISAESLASGLLLNLPEAVAAYRGREHVAEITRVVERMRPHIDQAIQVLKDEDNGDASS